MLDITKKFHAFFFDFDGVIVDSEKLKVEIYTQLFLPYLAGKKDFLTKYFLDRAGVSRVKKFHELIDREEDLAEMNNPKWISDLDEQASLLLVPKIIDCPLNDGFTDFVLKLKESQIPLFIVSGTEHHEINFICQQKQIASYFHGIYGAPRDKSEILNLIIKEYSLHPSEVFFIGDAMTDYKAAKDTQINFIGYGKPIGDRWVNGFRDIHLI